MFILLQFYYRLEFKALGPLLCIRDREVEISPLNFIVLMDMPEDSPFFTSDTFRLVVGGFFLPWQMRVLMGFDHIT